MGSSFFRTVTVAVSCVAIVLCASTKSWAQRFEAFQDEPLVYRGNDDGFDEGEATLGLLLLYGIGAAYVTSAPFWLPPKLVKEKWETGYFPGNPYEGDHDGYLMFEPELPNDAWIYGFQLSTEYAYDVEDISRGGGRLVGELSNRLGIDTELNYVRQDIAAPRNDQHWRGDFNIIFRFAQSERVQFRTGMGMNWLADEDGGQSGFNFTYGFTIFPVKPLVLSTDMDWGKLGDDPMIHARTTAGLLVNHAEFYFGYDYYNVDDIEVHGLVSGVRLWF